VCLGLKKRPFLQVKFVDPLNEFEGVSKYQSNIQMLKDSPLFGESKMDLHDAVVQPDGSVITRWTLSMTFKPFPWKPVSPSCKSDGCMYENKKTNLDLTTSFCCPQKLLFTGTSQYFVNEAGLVDKHLDKWDSIDQQSPFSMEALSVLVDQMKPDVTKAGVQILKGGALEEIKYTVLRKTKGMEIRRYKSFEIIETVNLH
jgi:hypothetical protein